MMHIKNLTGSVAIHSYGITVCITANLFNKVKKQQFRNMYQTQKIDYVTSGS